MYWSSGASTIRSGVVLDDVGLLGQGTVGGRHILERGGVGVLGRAAKREAAAMDVEDRAARLGAVDVDEDHGDAAQVRAAGETF